VKRDSENYNCSRFRERYGLRGEGTTSWVRGGNGLGAVAAWGDNHGTVCTRGGRPETSDLPSGSVTRAVSDLISACSFEFLPMDLSLVFFLNIRLSDPALN
jgi:hypothetical protein